MLRPLPLALLAALTLPGCATLSESRANPLNWFGPATAPATPVGQTLLPEGSLVAVVDSRTTMTVTRIEVGRTDSGALIRAEGIAPAPGYFNAQLVRVGIDGATLVLRLVAEPPAQPVAGAVTLTAATAINADTLAGLTGVRVEGAQGALTAGF